MATILLLLIYLAFISLGLPDSIIGVSWPVIQNEFGVPLEFGGYISLVVTLGTIVSSLLSGYIIAKLGTGKVIVLSIFLTSIALFGYSFSGNYFLLLICALPLGFGAGSIDTALNHYVSLHYKPHHMNWLHSFWGVGASIGPTIMAYFLVDDAWRKGFITIAIIQFVLMIIITISLPLWNREDDVQEQTNISKEQPKTIWKITGLKYALLIFLLYCAIEFSIGIWGASYLVFDHGMIAANAARIIMVYYLGITVGRFISGLLTFVLSNRTLIFVGIAVIFIASFLLLFVQSDLGYYVSFGLLGVGLAPIFPSMIHDTPSNFGKENAQYVIGYQIAFAYIGSAIFPSMFGILYSYISISLFPVTILILVVCLLIVFVLLLYRLKMKQAVFK